MKKLKTFEQMYSDPDIEAELGNIGREDDITPEELQAYMDAALDLDHIDDITKAIVKIRFKYEPKDNPLLKGIYFDAIKKWHKMLTSGEKGKISPKLQRSDFGGK
jgi:hypothetical protein